MEIAFQVHLNTLSDLDVLQERVKFYFRSDGPYNALESKEYKSFILGLMLHLKGGAPAPERCFLQMSVCSSERALLRGLYLQPFP